jgi:hypothetical protein
MTTEKRSLMYLVLFPLAVFSRAMKPLIHSYWGWRFSESGQLIVPLFLADRCGSSPLLRDNQLERTSRRTL